MEAFIFGGKNTKEEVYRRLFIEIRESVAVVPKKNTVGRLSSNRPLRFNQAEYDGYTRECRHYTYSSKLIAREAQNSYITNLASGQSIFLESFAEICSLKTVKDRSQRPDTSYRPGLNQHEMTGSCQKPARCPIQSTSTRCGCGASRQYLAMQLQVLMD